MKSYNSFIHAHNAVFKIMTLELKTMCLKDETKYWPIKCVAYVSLEYDCILLVI